MTENHLVTNLQVSAWKAIGFYTHAATALLKGTAVKKPVEIIQISGITRGTAVYHCGIATSGDEFATDTVPRFSDQK